MTQRRIAGTTVYPCTHRERITVLIVILIFSGISLYPQGTHVLSHAQPEGMRYIPVPTGNAFDKQFDGITISVYPCTHRERRRIYR